MNKKYAFYVTGNKQFYFSQEFFMLKIKNIFISLGTITSTQRRMESIILMRKYIFSFGKVTFKIFFSQCYLALLRGHFLSHRFVYNKIVYLLHKFQMVFELPKVLKYRV